MIGAGAKVGTGTGVAFGVRIKAGAGGRTGTGTGVTTGAITSCSTTTNSPGGPCGPRSPGSPFGPRSP